MLRFSATPLKGGGFQWSFLNDKKDIEHGVTISFHVREATSERGAFNYLSEVLPKEGITWLKPVSLPPWGKWVWDLSACKQRFEELKSVGWFEGEWTLTPEYEELEKGSPIRYTEAMTRFVVTKQDLDHTPKPIKATRNPKTVFVIHGRNEMLRKSLFKLLKAIGLEPKEWKEIIRETGKPLPYTLEAVEKGLETAGAVVALWSGDDIARLRLEHTEPEQAPEPETPQVRPNVIFETGLALAKDKSNVVILHVGETRRVSDLDGLNHVSINDRPARPAKPGKSDVAGRENFIERMRQTKAHVELKKNSWKRAGRFFSTVEVTSPRTKGAPTIPSNKLAFVPEQKSAWWSREDVDGKDTLIVNLSGTATNAYSVPLKLLSCRFNYSGATSDVLVHTGTDFISIVGEPLEPHSPKRVSMRWYFPPPVALQPGMTLGGGISFIDQYNHEHDFKVTFRQSDEGKFVVPPVE